MSPHHQIKYAVLAPCVGVGGADVFMFSLIQNLTNLTCSGIGLVGPYTTEQMDWAKRQSHVPIVTEHEKIKDLLNRVDVVLTWSVPNISQFLPVYKRPVIELAQNSDKIAKDICTSNTSVVDFQVAVSRHAATCFETQRPVTVIHNGVDPNRCTPRHGRETTRQQLGLVSTDKLLLFAGRLVPEKHPAKLVSVLEHLPANYKLMFVGSGPCEKDIFNLVKDTLSVPSRVLFSHQQEHIGDALAAADLFCLLSEYEGFSLAVLEAMLAGVPCILSNIPPHVELNAFCGEPVATLVELDATPSLIAHVCSSPNLFASTARALIWSRFTISRIAALWEEFILAAVHQWHVMCTRPTIYTVPK